jgi:nitrate reductase molybdenum cofactor assembly chaperone NarJ/NarW
MRKEGKTINIKTFLEGSDMIKTYKILSLLLSYPDPGLQQFLEEVAGELDSEELLNPDKKEDILKFTRHFGKMELIKWQAEYVQLFDYSRSASLHLFEHIKGDSRDRGQAMADLIRFYQESGLQLSANELPDYIPVFLEFLSMQEGRKASELLAEPINIIQRIFLALKEKDNPYNYLFSALISLSARQPDKKMTDLVIKKEKPLDLDNEYEEEPVRFDNNSSCINCK